MAEEEPKEELKEEAEEEARVAKLLEQSEELGSSSQREEAAPTLLTGTTKAETKEAKAEQLDTLLNKAKQYSQFIVSQSTNRQVLEAAARTSEGRKNDDDRDDDQDDGAEEGGHNGGKRKRRDLDDVSPSAAEKQRRKREDTSDDGERTRGRGENAAADDDDGAKGRNNNNNNLVQQPRNMVGGSLKGYQVEGLRWMATLYENGLSGILADEMGLGKTIQVIALVAHLREKHVAGPYIIAAPLATLPNWRKEFLKWTPSINVLMYHGNRKWRQETRKMLMNTTRQKFDDFPVIITSYEVCIMDRAALSKFDFKYLVIDEGQRVKNRDCRLVRELKKLKTENRLLLSGTPIQNTLEELWSLLNFVNPDIFDDMKVFQSWFGFKNIGRETQVDDILDDEARNRVVTKLHDILRPFLLRRVKKDVLAHLLPPKKEIVIYVPMSKIQRKYDIELKEKRLRETLVKSGVPSGRELSEQNTLMNHRKNANHPFLFGEPCTSRGEFVTQTNPRALVVASGKFQFLERLLPKLKSKGHKVLIFSQMTELLNLLEDFLHHIMEYETCRIDGAVQLEDRQRQIEEFNAEPLGENKKFVFMLSTRAGGLGINLASADTCIIFDSDWNPQQDSQAMDRCHRIGQKRPVVVYRLLTSGSVEIGMMEKQLSKKKLERMAITGGDFRRAGQRTNPDFNVDHLRNLLADDVNMAGRADNSGDKQTHQTNGKKKKKDSFDEEPAIADAELALLLDRTKIFDKEHPIPTEGEFYDVVNDSGGASSAGLFGSVS